MSNTPPDPGRPPDEGTHVVRQSQIVRWLGTLTVFKTDARTARNDPGRPPEVSAELGGTFPDIRSPADRYELLGEFGRGGMGVILRARDRVIGRELAMKVPFGGPGWDAVAEARFLREARITGQLQHPGIVPVYDVGRFADGRPFMAMRLVRGKPLDEVLAAGAPFVRQPARWVRTFELICRPVAYAHGKGVIHRDLKPHNVVLSADGHVWVLDWGLAKVLAEPDDPARAAARTEPPMDPGPGRTDHGTTLGTPGYMAPEQARSEPVDERADVFALGAILCQVLTGLPPFAHPDPAEVWRKNRAGEVAEALARLDGCGPALGLTGLAKRCLDPDPAGRPRDAREVLEEVGEIWAGLTDRPRGGGRD